MRASDQADPAESTRDGEPVAGGGGRARRSRWVGAVLGLLAGVFALVCALPLMGKAFVPVLAAALSAQVIVAGLVLLVMALASRRFIIAGCVVAALLLPALRIVGAPRAARADAAEPGSVVRILAANIKADNGTSGESIASWLIDQDADVVALIEPSWHLLEALRSQPVFDELYPDRHIPDRAGPGYPVLLSRWRQYAGDPPRPNSGRALVGGRLRLSRIDRPGGAFVFALMFPQSPRSPERWRKGEASLEHGIGMIRAHIGGVDLPMIAAGDFNDTPAGIRHRRLHDAFGLASSKSMLSASGTWPASLPWPLSVAIDDVLVNARCRVVSWAAVPIPGSDHRAVLAEIEIPRHDTPADATAE